MSILFKNTLIISSTLIVAVLITAFILYRIRKRSSSQRIKKLSKKLFIPLTLALLATALKIHLAIQTYIQNEEIIWLVKKITSLLFILVITWIVILTLRFIKAGILKHYDMGVEDNLKARKVYTQLNLIERIAVFIVILIAFSIALMSFDEIRKIGITLFASAGIAGIIIGLAAQKVIGTILAGLQIAITQPIRIDDVVIVENEWGWVEEISLTYVVVRIWDKRRLILPSTYFIEKPFQNWTRVSSDILGTVFIYTDYTVSVDAIRQELTEILKTTNLWDGEVNVVQVTDTTPSTMEIRLLVSAKNSQKAWDLRVLIREKIIHFLQTHYRESLPKTRIVIDQPGLVSDKKKTQPFT